MLHHPRHRPFVCEGDAEGDGATGATAKPLGFSFKEGADGPIDNLCQRRRVCALALLKHEDASPRPRDSMFQTTHSFDSV